MSAINPELAFSRAQEQTPPVMQGVITSRDVLRHLPLIWRKFGTGCALRCLHAVLVGRVCTFLDLM